MLTNVNMLFLSLSLSQALAAPTLKCMLTFGNAMMPPGNMREAVDYAPNASSRACAR